MFIKKNLKLLLLGLFTPLLCGVSFGLNLSQDDITYLDRVALNSGSFNNVNAYTLFDGSLTAGSDLCVIFNDFSVDYNGIDTNGQLAYFIGGTNQLTNTVRDMYWYYSNNFNMFCFPVGQSYVRLAGGSYVLNFTTSKFWAVKVEDIVNGNMGIDVDSLVNNLQDCQSNLNNCDTTVQQCLIDKQTLSGNLATCNSDKESLINYNEALSTQLNECLNNQGTGSNLSGLILNNNSLFRYLDDSLLSLPINNNLFLPLGYQGALDSGNVLYIKAIDEDEPINYYVAEEDKISIIDILSYLFIFLLGIGVIFSLIKLFRKLFTH